MKHFLIKIFGSGDTQIKGDEFSIKVKTNTLRKAKPLIDAIWALRPTDIEPQKDFECINIFDFNDLRYLTKNGFSLKTTPELKAKIENLIAELKLAYDALPSDTSDNSNINPSN